MKFKVLMHGKVFVDERRLDQGVFVVMQPKLHRENMTMKSLESAYRRQARIFKDVEIVIDNLRACVLKSVTLTID